jgi:transcriptional regulator with XRE-family HTH domain
MSDLYIVLRRRLEAVPEWVYIDSALLRAARERQGFSYETIARQIPVVSKTYERYEKAGRVPRQLLAKIAELLDLEIEEPERTRIMVEPAEPRGSVRDEISSLRTEIRELDQKLDVALGQRLDRIEQEIRTLTRVLDADLTRP